MEEKSATNTSSAEVGVREFRDGLSRHLATVREGGRIVVTDHGKPFAVITPLEARSRIDELTAEGRLSVPEAPRAGELPPLIEADGSVVDLFLSDHEG